MSDPAPVVTDLRRIDYGDRAPGRIVAHLSCRVGGVLLIGLRLERGQDDALRVSNAIHKGGASKRAVGVVIVDDALRAAILAAAQLALVAPPADSLRRRRGRRTPA